MSCRPGDIISLGCLLAPFIPSGFVPVCREQSIDSFGIAPMQGFKQCRNLSPVFFHCQLTAQPSKSHCHLNKQHQPLIWFCLHCFDVENWLMIWHLNQALDAHLLSAVKCAMLGFTQQCSFEDLACELMSLQNQLRTFFSDCHS